MIRSFSPERSPRGGFFDGCGRKQSGVSAFRYPGTTAAQVARQAAGIALAGGLAAVPAFSEDLIPALTNGSVWVFPGRRATGKPPMVVASRSSMAPLDRLRRAAGEHDLARAAFTEVPKPPRMNCWASDTEVVLIERSWSASLLSNRSFASGRPVRTADV
jgi:hypothetical protein